MQTLRFSSGEERVCVEASHLLIYALSRRCSCGSRGCDRRRAPASPRVFSATASFGGDDDAPPAPPLPPGRLHALPPLRAPPGRLRYEGLGVHTYADGSVYAGDWRAGRRAGWGVFTTPDGCRYAGRWRADKQEGLGVASYPSGNRYEGEFVADARHGRGLFLLKSTARFIVGGGEGNSKRASLL